jgi:hypothetical protein
LATTVTYTEAANILVKDLSGNVITCGTLVHEFLKSDSTSLVSASPFIYSIVNSTKSFQLSRVVNVASVGTTYLKLKVSLLSWPNSSVAIKDFKV